MRRNGWGAARTRGARWLITLAILIGAWSARSPALEPGYLERWPDVARVLADNPGRDRDDTLARQMAALHVLRDGIEYAAGPRRRR